MTLSPSEEGERVSLSLSVCLLICLCDSCSMLALGEVEATDSHVKPQILLLLEEEIQDKLPHKIRIASVVDHLRPAKLHTGRSELAVAASHESAYTIKSEKGKKKKKTLEESSENAFFHARCYSWIPIFPVKISPL